MHSKPVHLHNSSSPFSKESSEQNYRGFLNLIVLLLFISMARLALENFRKYGVLLSIPGRNIPVTDLLFILPASLLLWFNVLTAYGLERYIVCRPQFCSSKSYYGIMVLNVSILLFLPSWIVWTHMYHPLVGFFVLFLALVLCMKIISYHLTNAELRSLRKFHIRGDPYSDCPYPQNILLNNFLYFWIAPTLCYQPSYPKAERIRLKFLIKRLVEFTACIAVIHILTEQYAIPTVQNSMKMISDLDWIGMLERILKLSISSLYIWLVGFYALFHSFLNAFAEIIKFGDRDFYKAWWNANSIDDYWRLWNTPVHQWFKRHVYNPLIARGWSAKDSQLIIFIFSAVAHEFLVAVPTHVVQGWALIGMLLQVPLISLTTWYMRRRPDSSFGNYFFWISFCILGQPMCVLLYYRAWITQNPSTVAPPSS